MKFCLNGGLLLGTVGKIGFYIPRWYVNGWFAMVDGANIEIAEEVGEDNVCELVGFVMNPAEYWYNSDTSFLRTFDAVRLHFWIIIIQSSLIPSVIYSAVEDLRYQHLYHKIPIEQKCPALAEVLKKISGGAFGDGGVYEPYALSFVYSNFSNNFIVSDSWTRLGNRIIIWLRTISIPVRRRELGCFTLHNR